ncbi:unnamed protein product [Urochloa humidicola]
MSLVHDDLACMDDDALHHSRPANHVTVEVTTVLLAGEALLALSFEHVARDGDGNSVTAKCAFRVEVHGAREDDREEPRGEQVTYPNLMGVDGARAYVVELVVSMKAELSRFDAARAAPLRHLVCLVVYWKN